MTTFEANFLKQETEKVYKIVHLPKADVVLNLEATYPGDQTILEILQKDDSLLLEDSMNELSEVRDPFGNPQFHIKFKGTSQSQVDFIRGRTKVDPLISQDISKKGRYAFAGVLSEMVLSNKIKELVASSKFQEVATEYGFSGFVFAEPLAAVVDKNSDQRYVVYNWMREVDLSDEDETNLKNLTPELRRLFVANQISPGDLSHRQFMIVGEGAHKVLVLIDIEAYTKISKPHSI